MDRDLRGAVDERPAHDHLEPHRVQPADAHGKAERMLDRHERDRPSVERDVEPAREARGVRAGIDALLLRLERRDLREVEDVADVQPVAGHLDAGEAVDREVAERVRLRGDGREQRCCKPDEHDELLHRSAPFRATGVQRTEKRGLSASARRYHCAAPARSPRHAAIQPRWKNFRASCVPRRSDRLE